jgi:hypothetical protein
LNTQCCKDQRRRKKHLHAQWNNRECQRSKTSFFALASNARSSRRKEALT